MSRSLRICSVALPILVFELNLSNFDKIAFMSKRIIVTIIISYHILFNDLHSVPSVLYLLNVITVKRDLRAAFPPHGTVRLSSARFLIVPAPWYFFWDHLSGGSKRAEPIGSGDMKTFDWSESCASCTNSAFERAELASVVSIKHA